MLSDGVKSRLAAAFVSTQYTSIGTRKDLVIGSYHSSITRKRILEVLTDIMDIMNQQRLVDVDVDGIEEGIVENIYTKGLPGEQYFKDSLDFM
ncbi:hypothetical protein Clacol_008017 [Clathrus columnatus]|uniref:Uncharacterized protein n=1 Tax=Clathrus columnatus TaxID=1419009 RepID=A0AAV5AMV9_9AGAM|nr:hypothetical protein Clacol_008017 [Clathrus columnatus]